MAKKLSGSVRFWLAGVVLVVLVAAASAVWYNVQRTSAPPTLQQEVLSIGAQLRVPSEQDTMTVATSPESVAQHMRYEIQQDLLQGQGRQQIIRDMEQKYGAQVLAAPAKKGFGGLVWTIPAAALAVGLVLLFFYFFRLRLKVRDASAQLSKEVEGKSEERIPEKYEQDIHRTLQDYL